MNYNAFIGAGDGFPTDQSHYTPSHQVAGNPRTYSYNPYDEIRSQGHRAQEGYMCSDAGRGYNRESLAAVSFGGIGGGGDAGSSFRYGSGGAGPGRNFNSHFDDGSSRYFAAGGGGDYDGTGGRYGCTSAAVAATASVPRGLDVPRAPGAPRPLTTSPTRPLFRPLAAAVAPTPSTSVLSYGFYGLPAMPPAQPPISASKRVFTPRHRSSSPSPQRHWPSNSASSSAAAAAACVTATASTSRVPAPSPGQQRPAWERRPPATSAFPAAAQQKQLQQQAQQKQQPEEGKTQGTRVQPPALRLLSGTVERVVSWLHLSQSHSLLFEVFGMVMSVSGNDPWILRLRDSGTGIAPALASGACGGEPVLEVVFYGMDRRLPPLQLGEAARCVGRALGRARIQAFAVRAAAPAEIGLAQRLGFVCQRAVRELTASASASSTATSAADEGARPTATRRR